MFIKNVYHFCNCFNESMSVKEWKIKNGFSSLDNDYKKQLNDVLAWYRQKDNEKVRKVFPLQDLSPYDVIFQIGNEKKIDDLNKILSDKSSYNTVMETDKIIVISPLTAAAATHIARTMISPEELVGEDSYDEDLKDVDKGAENYSPTWCIASSSADMGWEMYGLYNGNLTYFIFFKEKRYHGLRFAMVLDYEKYQNFLDKKISLKKAIREFREPSQQSGDHMKMYNLFIKKAKINPKTFSDTIRKYAANTHNDLITNTKHEKEHSEGVKGNYIDVKATELIRKFLENPCNETFIKYKELFSYHSKINNRIGELVKDTKNYKVKEAADYIIYNLYKTPAYNKVLLTLSYVVDRMFYDNNVDRGFLSKYSKYIPEIIKSNDVERAKGFLRTLFFLWKEPVYSNYYDLAYQNKSKSFIYALEYNYNEAERYITSISWTNHMNGKPISDVISMFKNDNIDLKIQVDFFNGYFYNLKTHLTPPNFNKDRKYIELAFKDFDFLYDFAEEGGKNSIMYEKLDYKQRFDQMENKYGQRENNS